MNRLTPTIIEKMSHRSFYFIRHFVSPEVYFTFDYLGDVIKSLSILWQDGLFNKIINIIK